MKIKYKESQPEKGVNGYLTKVLECSEKLKEFFNYASSQRKVVSLSEANNTARLKFGPTWYYSESLDLPLDARHEDLNKKLYIQNDTLIAPIAYMVPVLESASLNPANQNKTVNTNTLTDIDFMGSWGTPIQSDDSLHDITQSSGNTTVQRGQSPGNYQMQSGYDYAKSSHSDEVNALTRLSERKSKIKLKL
jgi:hypothetical protein